MACDPRAMRLRVDEDLLAVSCGLGGDGLSAGTRILVRRRPIPAVAEDILGDSC